MFIRTAAAEGHRGGIVDEHIDSPKLISRRINKRGETWFIALIERVPRYARDRFRRQDFKLTVRLRQFESRRACFTDVSRPAFLPQLLRN